MKTMCLVCMLSSIYLLSLFLHCHGCLQTAEGRTPAESMAASGSVVSKYTPNSSIAIIILLMTRAGSRRDNLNVILMSEHVPLVGTRPATTTTAQPKTKTNTVTMAVC